MRQPVGDFVVGFTSVKFSHHFFPRQYTSVTCHGANGLELDCLGLNICSKTAGSS